MSPTAPNSGILLKCINADTTETGYTQMNPRANQ